MESDLLTVEEARELMPSTTANLTDEEVAVIVNNLGILADSIIKAVLFNDDFRVNIAYN